MAKRYYGLDNEAAVGNAGNVTENSSTTSKAVELVVDLTKVDVTTPAGRQQVLDAIEKLEYYVSTAAPWPPA